MARVRKIAMFGALGTTLLLGGGAWTLFSAEEIPAELQPVGDPDSVVIPGIGEQPDLEIAGLRGKTTFFVMVGVANWGSDEGQQVNRALNRWTFPDDTEGYIIFDAAGFGFLAEKSSKYMKEFSSEARFPMYGDFEGTFRDVFKLAGGHHGLVVLGPDGEVKLRKSGGISDDTEIDALREMLNAEEPEVGPEVPDFALASVSDEACADQPCAVVFLGRSVARSEVPGIDDGFEGESEERWEQWRKPDVRMVGAALRFEPQDRVHAVLVGETPGLEFPGWQQVATSPEVREAFDVAPDQTSWFVLKDGRVQLRLDGVMPFYRYGEIADHLGVEFKQDD